MSDTVTPNRTTGRNNRRNSGAGRGTATVTPSGVEPGSSNAAAPATPLSTNFARQGAIAAKRMMKRCVRENTEVGYVAKMKLMVAWFKENPMVDEEDNPIALFQPDNETLKLPVPTDCVLAFFGYLGDQKVNSDGQTSDDAEILKASSTMGGYRSALVWYYGLYGKMKLSEDLDTSLSTYMSGYKRTITDLKLRGVMNIHEGKRPLEFEGYKVIAGRFLRISPTSHPADPKKKIGSWAQQLFAWSYFIFCWNLMARSVTVGRIMYQHISWSGDALIVNVPGHKGDQEGAKDYGRHVYANPLEPSICPILSLAVMIFSSTFRTGDKRQQLFEGNHSESRFSAILRVIVDALDPADERTLGAKKKDIGTHSPRKGSPSYALAMIEGPNPVQVFLRAGWSLGNVQDRYLFAGKGGDQLVGRTVSGLPMSDESFGVLPPHFTREIVSDITEIQWSQMLPNYSTYPECFRTALPFLLASLIYHDGWLRGNLDSRHPLFNSRLYTSGLHTRFVGRVLVGNVVCPVTKLTATGVPAHIMLNKSIRDLSLRVDELERSHKRGCDSILGAIGDLREDLPKALRREILDNFQVDGALPLTQVDLDRSLDAIVVRLEDSIDRRFNSQKVAETPAVVEPPPLPAVGDFDSWTWGGRVGQFFPPTFRMPECTVKCLWDLWHFGHKQQRIRPYKLLKSFNLHVFADRSELSKARGVISALHDIGVEQGLIPIVPGKQPHDYVSVCTLAASDGIFQAAYEALAARIFTAADKHRLGELRFNYVYNVLCKWIQKQLM